MKIILLNVDKVYKSCYFCELFKQTEHDMPSYDYDLDFDHYSRDNLRKLVETRKSITISPEMETEAKGIRSQIEKAFPGKGNISDRELHVAKLYETRIRFPELYAELLAQQNTKNLKSSLSFFALGVASATAVAAASVATYMYQNN